VDFAQRHPITDIGILVGDIERSIAFYRDKLGFRLWHRMPDFVDFQGAGLTLALWTREHINRHTGVGVPPCGAASAFIAVRLDEPTDVDRTYDELRKANVAFVGIPADYPWNVRAAYFKGPDGEVWELYAWHDGGAPGALDKVGEP
jgi:catechol 2,3-dioxygenase-like lactoylglutathione lyase family enzyme